MAHTITVAALKGGVGKSTLAINLASCLHKASHKVLIVDTDSQATCRMWAAKAAEAGHQGPPVVSLDGKALDRDLERIAAGFDVVLIDTPARMGEDARAAMLAADLVIMPTMPGGADVWALRETLDVLDSARKRRPELRAAVVFNRADRTTLATIARKALDNLGVPVLSPSLGNRVAFGEATLAGLSVLDIAPSSLAARELEQLTKAVLGAMAVEEEEEKNVKTAKG